ncbi:MAG: choline ABC transporter permease subunit [Rhodobacteraceae bacterium]|nr:MAG: choline ABC transporter permease subunit [Paracoccaceae bacterium]
MDWITGWKIPVGRTAADAVDWLIANASWFFDALADGMDALIAAALWALQTPPPLAVIAAFTLLAFVLRRSFVVAALVLLGLLFVLNQGYWRETTETLTLVLAAVTVCMGLGVPIGIAAAHRPKLYAALRPVLDLMQTLPTFVYLIPAIVFFGIGMTPGLMATAIFVIPAPIRLTHLGISSVPRDLIEAGQAFGATRAQLLWKVELPSALPQILAGMTQTIMLSLSMVVIAALVGADGLGVPVVRALNTVNTALGFEAGFVIVVLAVVLDRVFRPGKASARRPGA